MTDGKPGVLVQRTVQVQVTTGPTITSLTAIPDTVPRNGIVSVVCVATAPDNGALEYLLSADSGTITQYVSSAAWTAPNSTGTYNLTCTASVPDHGSASQSVQVLVNSRPAIDSLTASPAVVSTGSFSTIVCAAADPDGDELEYFWSSVAGSTITGLGASVVWTAPVSTGTYEIICGVTDGKPGVLIEKNVLVQVATGPMITSLTAVPDTIPRNGVASVICVATAPDNGALEYIFTASSGSVTAYASSAAWTAPNATGTYSVTCEARVAGQGSDSESVAILVNSRPSITSLTAEPTIVSMGGEAAISCLAEDPDGDELFYAWTSVAGSTITGLGANAVWTAPQSTGTYTIICGVTDGKPGVDIQRGVSVQVATGPVITSLTATPDTIPRNGEVSVVCVATAPDNGELLYTLTASSGGLVQYVSSAAWTAPNATGTYSVTCEAGVTGMDSARGSVEILVNSPPVITSLTAEPAIVSTGAVSALVCAASDPDGDELTYTWTSVEGSTIAGGGASVVWTAPESTGTYAVGCSVTDGKPGVLVQTSAQVRVVSGPMITSLTATPDTIARQGVTSVVCVATAPDNGALVYTLSAASGTLVTYVSSASWTAPDSTGTYSVACVAAVTGHGSAGESVAILVNSKPVINSLTAEPTIVSTGAVSALVCAASDPDSDEMFYSWSAVEGSTITGGGASVTWTAPVSTGTYDITCGVTDGKPGVLVQESVQVRVTAGPLITSLTATPDTIPRNGVASVVCVATAPDNGALVYALSAASGTLVQYVSSASWTAPDSTGVYNVACEAGVPGHGSASGSVTILVNSPPAVSALTAEPSIVSTGAAAQLTCAASDPDGDELTYSWASDDGGAITGSGAAVTWTAPASTGAYSVTCGVTDGKPGILVLKSVLMQVSTSPLITSLTATPDTIPRNGEVSVVCVATAPDNGELQYAWSADSGTVTAYVSSAAWTAPNATGTYNVTCQARVEGHGSASASVPVMVNSRPLIDSVTAMPAIVSTGAVSEIACLASDPDGDELAYTWTSVEGSTITGGGASVSWTAPASTGIYSVTCLVSDGKPGTPVQRSAQVQVSNGPVIESLIATPDTVARNGTASVVCVATAPDNGALVYNWSADSGTVTAYISSAAWTAPNATGTYRVTCEAGVAGHGSDRMSVPVLVNSRPVIDSLTAAPGIVSTGSVAMITCAATDPDGDGLSYTWTSVAGSTITGDGATVAWTAPAAIGAYQITCAITDGKPDVLVSQSVEVKVATAPIITELTATPDTIARNGEVSVVCVATAPDNAELNYAWSADSGSVTAYVSSASWTAPNATGTYIITCEASAVGHGSARAGVPVLVNSRPSIDTVTAEPPIVSTGSASVISCAASDPDGDTLIYSWTAVEGSTITGSGASVSWTAPAATGTYPVNCGVTDGKPGALAQKLVQVTVATGPMIISLTATPETVARNGEVSVVCVATAPDSGELIYNWRASSGSLAAYVSSASWTAPNATGTYSVTCEAGVAGRGTASDSVAVLVNSRPRIEALTAEPSIVSTGANTALTCSATDLDGDELAYTWSAIEGSTLTGSGAVVTWTAPVSTGVYEISCAVTDGKQGVPIQSRVLVQVATGAAILSLSASPETVARNGVATVVCVATAPDNAELEYAWSASSGNVTAYSSSAAWTAPDATGTYSVTCEAGAAGRDKARASLGILVNGRPGIASVTAEPSTVSTGSVSSISCAASDPDGDVLTYSWTAVEGSTITGLGAAVTWTAPVATGTYAITCGVTDGKPDVLEEKTVQVQVTTGPEITSLTATPDTIPRNGVSSVVCVATAPDNGALAYTLSAASGTLVQYVSSASWTAPNATGTYSVTCEAGVAGHGSTSRSVEILVNSIPAIDSLTADPAIVSTGSAAVLTCRATDPDNEELFYTWTAVAGSTITGSGATVSWTAPAATGAYIISCGVSDGKPGVMVLQGVQVRVATGPEITSLYASPETVPRNEVANVVCVATAPDNAALTYSWSMSGGSAAAYVSSAAWTAPNTTGTYSVTCEASAAGHGSTSRSVEILVNGRPVINALSAEPSIVSTGTESVITCAATDPDGDELAYTWSSVAGSTITGTGASVTWKAPAGIGTYQVNCVVTDGKPGIPVQRSLQMQVANGPAINSLTAAPDTVARNAATSVVCVATAPNNGALTYSLTAASGTLVQYVSSASWTAPNATGTYHVACEASVPGQGSAQASVAILVNSRPAISALTAEPVIVSTGAETALVCSASDPDGDALAYMWTSVAGSTITGTGASVAWKAPVSTGTYEITCEVTDGKPGAAVQQHVLVQVATGPAILSLSASPDTTARNGVVNLVCVATAPDNGALQYAWTATSGTASGSGSEFAWTAPNATGTYSITCQAFVPGHGSASSTVAILVNSPPAIDNLTAEPAIISTGAQSALLCAATDPDSDAMAYTWTAPAGSTITGSGAAVTWKAPVSTGVYTVTCGVTDGKPGVLVQRSVTVQVATGPAITSLTAEPATVPRNGAVSVVCVATAPDNGALTYSLTAASGSLTSYVSSATWTAPNSTGTYNVTCQASVPGKGSASRSLAILVNSRPTISFLTAEPKRVTFGAVSSVTCSAADLDSDQLTYNWYVTGGSTASVSGQSPYMTWTAPVSTGLYTITCDVSDGKAGDPVQQSIQVRVSTGPEITSLTADHTTVVKSGVSNMVCVATAPDNGAMVYEWTAASGTTTGSGTSFAWTAPNATGTYVVSCGVSVAGQGSTSRSLQVLVNSPPIVSGVSAVPAMVSTMSVSTITCAAADPDGDVLEYTWSKTGGSISGTGAEVQWTSPVSSGAYVIGCQVSDGKPGGVAVGEKMVTVSTIPIISDLKADPASVSSATVSTITCTAAGPGDETLAYDWYATGGSTQSISGNGSKMRWTAPASTGTYTITCDAHGSGGFARRTVGVLVNNPPVISSVTAVPSNVFVRDISTITCAATDPDNPVLVYNWTMSTGSYSVISSSVIAWTAPASSGTYTITCTVLDGEGGSAQDSVNVTAKENTPPVIDSLAAVPNHVVSMPSPGQAVITCLASDDDGDALAYTWTAASGTKSGSGYQITWTAPAATGTYIVGCSVADGRGGTAQQNVSILVNNPPQINSLAADPVVVAKMSVSTVTCAATDLDNAVIYYDWYVTGGSTVAVEGNPSIVAWTAPNSTGSYTVRCTASDGEGGSTDKSVLIAVSTVPVINSLTAIPVRAVPNGEVTLTCSADGPNNEPLTYAWTPAAGSIAGSDAQVTWTAPAVKGLYSIKCAVTGSGGTVERSVDMLVNTPPFINSLTAVPALVSPSAVSTVTCAASDADGDALTYSWTAQAGSTHSVVGYTSTITWNAPASTGTFAVTCNVSDGSEAGVAQDNKSIIVSTVPLITAVTASPPSVLQNGVSTITCTALDPDSNETLTYAWTAQAGSTKAIAGDGSQMRWTAPVSSGTYGITCAATSHGGTAYKTLQMTAGGARLWVDQPGSAGADYGYSVAIDTSGNALVAGSAGGQLTPSTTWYGAEDAFLSKYDTEGNNLWTVQVGSDAIDGARGVAVDLQGNILIAGYTASVIDGQPHAGGAYDAFVAKFDSAGNKLWLREAGTVDTDKAFSVAVDTAGNVYMAGQANADSGDNYSNAFLVKYSSGGDYQWDRIFTLGDAYSVCNGVSVDSSGNVYLAGKTGEPLNFWNAFLVKYDRDGNQKWVQTIDSGDDDYSYSIAIDSSDGIYITGMTWANLGGPLNGGSDVFLIKYDTGGTKVWTKQFGTSGNESGLAVTTHSGYVYVSGTTSGVFPGNAWAGSNDFFLAKYTTAGDAVWAQEYGSPGYDSSYGVATDSQGNVFLTGYTGGIIPPNTSQRGVDFYLTKYAK
ncbi:MAG: SBBP repeat-containing protein [Elusimicrobia bacterium]|nr:SBBP repeat-containing protein [Elusimicrobiota bacterium]